VGGGGKGKSLIRGLLIFYATFAFFVLAFAFLQLNSIFETQLKRKFLFAYHSA